MADDPFRVFLAAGFLVLLPIIAYHRVRSATREKLDRRQEGLFILLTLRPLGLATLVGYVTWLVSPTQLEWLAMPLPSWFRWAGVVLWLAAATLIVWTVRCLGPNLTDTIVTRKTHTLVMAGPYRWVRHPFYLGVGLLLVASGVIAANWALVVTSSGVFVLFMIRTRREEQHLLARFGDDYRAYVSRTGRFLPRSGRRR